MPNGKRSSGQRQDPLSRVERLGEAGFVTYCKCEVFRFHSHDDMRRDPDLRGRCRSCGSVKREWRCPRHGLRAVPLLSGSDSFSHGCPRCGAPPMEMFHDQYMTGMAKHGG